MSRHKVYIDYCIDLPASIVKYVGCHYTVKFSEHIAIGYHYEHIVVAQRQHVEGQDEPQCNVKLTYVQDCVELGRKEAGSCCPRPPHCTRHDLYHGLRCLLQVPRSVP